MKKIIKFLIFTIVLSLALFAFSACKDSNETAVSSFNELKDALNADNAEVMLTQDINTNEVLYISKLFTLNLNGKTLTVKGLEVGTDLEGILTIKKGNITSNGNIEILAPKATINLHNVYVNISQNSKITLNGSKNTVNIDGGSFRYINKSESVPLRILAETRVVISDNVINAISLNVIGGDVIIENNSKAIGNKITVAESVTSKVDIKNSGNIDTVENNSAQDEIISIDNTTAAIPPIVTGAGAEKVEQKKDGEKLITYNVTYETNGGSAISKYNVIKDSKITSKETKKQGYTLDGWYIDESFNDKAVFPLTVTENITLYAKWTVKSYPITFISDEETVSTIEKEFNQTIDNPPLIAKEGYALDGWYDGNTKVTFPYTVTDNKTLTAKWTLNLYTVTFDTDGSLVDSEIKGHNGTIIYSPITKKEGYTFDGWYDGETKVTFPYRVTENKTLTAKWIINQYKIIFNPNGGTKPMFNNTTALYDSEITYIGSFPSRIDYIFDGWYLNETKIDFPYIVKGDTEFIAKWIYAKTDGLEFSQNDDGTYTLKGKNSLFDNNITEIYVPTIYNGAPVTKIEQYAFHNDETVTKVILPSTIDTIYSGAFKNCINLIEINIPYGIKNIPYSLFDNCKSLKRIFLPNTVTEIGFNAFNNCINLEYINLPDDLTEIKGGTFSSCSSLSSVTIPDKVISIEANAFSNCSRLSSVVIPEKVVSIGANAFSECSSLSSVIIPDSVTFIAREAFSKCIGLSEITIGNGIKQISENTFYKCENLINVSLGNSLTSIDKWAFANCINLKTIIIPNSVKSLDYWAFSGCEKLEKISIPAEVAYFYNNSIKEVIITGNGVIANNAFREVVSLTDVTVEDTVTGIGSNVFLSTTWKKNLPDGLKYLGKIAYKYVGEMPTNSKITLKEGTLGIAGDAFSSCKNLREIILPDSVLTIGRDAFSYCDGLETIFIPKNVEKIYPEAFYSCDNLAEIEVDKDNVYYKSDSNCLIDIENKTLILGCKNSVIPDDGSVTAIGMRAFMGSCPNEIIVPNGVISIGDYAFFSGDYITRIRLSKSVVHLGVSVFTSLSELESIEVEDGNPKYKSDGNCLIDIESKTLILGCKNSVIPDDGSVTSIGNRAFYFNKNLKSILIPESVTAIKSEAFAGCANLIDVTLSDGLLFLGTQSFYQCFALINLILPDTLTEISDHAFYGCENLTNILIPQSVVSLGLSPFYGCKNIESLEVENGNANYYSVDNCIIETATNQLIIGCKNSIIPSDGSVSIIGQQAFSGSGLIDLVIPEAITSIETSAFSWCQNLKSIILPSNLTKLAESIFLQCVKLREVVIPNSVTTIERYAFYNCINLNKIIIKDAIDTIGNEAFGDCLNLTVFAETAAKPDGWHNNWNPENLPVIWGYNSEIVYTFVTNGGSAVDYQCNIIEESPFTSKEGYTFGGWYNNLSLEGEPITFPYTDNNKTVLFAKWTIESYTVEFYSDEVLITKLVELYYNQNIHYPPTVDKTDYTFDGCMTEIKK